MARARNVIFLCLILLGIGDKNVAVQISDAKRCVSRRKIWVDKTTHGYPVEIFVKYVDPAAMKVGGVKKIMAMSHAHGQAFVDIILSAFNSYNSVGLVQGRVPAGYCAVFTDENEKRRRRDTIFCYLEERRIVKHNIGGIRSLAGGVGWDCYDQRNRTT